MRKNTDVLVACTPMIDLLEIRGDIFHRITSEFFSCRPLNLIIPIRVDVFDKFPVGTNKSEQRGSDEPHKLRSGYEEKTTNSPARGHFWKITRVCQIRLVKSFCYI